MGLALQDYLKAHELNPADRDTRIRLSTLFDARGLTYFDRGVCCQYMYPPPHVCVVLSLMPGASPIVIAVCALSQLVSMVGLVRGPLGSLGRCVHC